MTQKWYGREGYRRRVAIRLEGFEAADDSSCWPSVNPYLETDVTAARHFIDGVLVWYKHRRPGSRRFRRKASRRAGGAVV